MFTRGFAKPPPCSQTMASTSWAGSKRKLPAVKMVTLKINDNEEKAVTVQPHEAPLTLKDYLQEKLKPVDGRAWCDIGLSVSFDRPFINEARLDDTLESLGVFSSETHTIVLVVHSSGVPLHIPKPADALRRLVGQTEWGERITSVKAIQARDKAIADVVAHARKSGQSITEQVMDVRNHLRGRAVKWIVEFEPHYGERMFKIGDRMRVTMRCVDRIGLSANVDGDIDVRIHVRSQKQVSGGDFDFPLKLKQKDLRDGPVDGRTYGEEGADASSFAWHGVPILCLPKEQPRGLEQPFTLTVTTADDSSTTGSSEPFHIEEEETMDGKANGPPEVDAKLLYKWWDDTLGACRAPHSASGLQLLAGGGASVARASIITHQRPSRCCVSSIAFHRTMPSCAASSRM